MNSQMHSTDQSGLFLRDKRAWESAIASYDGPDPLEMWYNYICWYEYNMSVDPEEKFRESLERCLTLFEQNEDYKQDVRMVKLWVKYIDLQANPLSLYQILYQRGVGTRCSCFYIGWAHYYDSANAFKQAESVYNLGFQAKAEPYDEIQEAHTKFRLSLSQRMLYTDNSSKKRSVSSLIEQRQQITTLNPSKRSRQDSTDSTDGSADCSAYPEEQVNNTQTTPVQNQTQPDQHQVQYPQQQQQLPQIYPNQQVYAQQQQQQVQHQPQHTVHHLPPQQPVHHQPQQAVHQPIQQPVHQQTHENYHQVQQVQQQYHHPQQNHHYEQPTNHQTAQSQQPVQSQTAQNHLATNYTHVAASEQCNLKNSAYVISSSLNYIYNDTQDDMHHQMNEYHLENVKLSQNFVRYCKTNHESWKPLLCIEEPYDPNRRCCYRKDLVYPADSAIEFSPEEIRARKWSKRLQELRCNKINEQQAYQQQQHKSSKSHGQYNNVQQAATSYSHSYQDQDQFEASTIRFTSDTGHGVKNKSITIKFRREAPNSNSFSSSVNYGGDSYEIVPQENSYSNEQNSYQHTNGSSQYQRNGENYYSDSNDYNKSNVDYNRQSIPETAPKPKKVKKIKIVNKYDDTKHNNNSTGNGSAHSSKKTSTAVSNNQYDDANLLLSIANMHSNEIRASDNSTDTLTYNDDSCSNTDFNSTYSESTYPNYSNSSTPIRKLSQSFSSKTSTPLCRSLKRHISNVSLQNDDSLCSYEQNSFFASEQNEELRQKRLEKALATINTHLAKEAIDPFNSELCKAFLTKIGFPKRNSNEPYKLVNTPIAKLASVRVATLADEPYSIEKEVGRGSYGSVYKATNNATGAVVALKYQKPANIWEIYICAELGKRISNYDILPGFMDLSSAIIAPNASILVTEFSPFGSLLDINNKLRQSTKKVMHESLVMHFSSQILNVVSHLHSCKIVHADIKPDNFLLMRIPNSDSHIPSLRLIDFGCAIDMTLFPEKTEFKKVVQTDGFTCIEMQEGRHWSYQTDYFCVAGTIHVMLFGEYMQLIKKFGAWEIKQKLPRYLKKHVWTDFFSKMLNIQDVEHLPDLIEMKCALDDEASKMDSELQTQIRTLSNLLHRR